MARGKKEKRNAKLFVWLAVAAAALVILILCLTLGKSGENFSKTYEKATAKSGVIYRSARFVTSSDTDIYPVLSGEKYYYKTKYNGKTLTLTEAEFDDARAATEYSTDGKRNWYAAVCKDGKWGFLQFFESTNDKGKAVIDKKWLAEPAYENAEPFSDGVAAVKKGGKYGLIGLDGEELGTFSYENIKYYSSGFLPVCKNGSWSFVNIYGKQLIKGVFLDAESFENGYAAVKTEKGNFAVEPQYTDAWAVGSDGEVYVKESDTWEKITVGSQS